MGWILLLAAIAYGGSVFAPFYLDDFALLSDPAVTSAEGWYRCFAPLQTRPLTWFTFWLNYQAGGAEPAGYHFVNLLLHLACVVAAWDVLKRIAPEALAAAAVFALHPIQTEAVVSVFARSTLLMSLFCLLALREWTRGRQWRAVPWFALALLAKEECVAFPLVLLLLPKGGATRRPVAAMLCLSLIFGVRVLWAATTIAGSGAGTEAGISPLAYFLTQGVAILRYLQLMVAPVGISMESPLSPAGVGTGIAAWAAIAVSAVAAAKRFEVAGRWWIGGLVLLLPSSSILPAADLSAERRMYLPVLFFALAVLFFALAAATVIRRRPKQWAVAGLSIALAAVSMQYTLLYQDPAAVWRKAIAAAPTKVRPRIQLARSVPPQEALEVLAEAQKIAPKDPAIASERGRVLLETGNPGAALAEFGRALGLAPGDARAVNNRGVALQRLGQTEAAKADFRRALTIDPCLADPYANLEALGETAARPEHCQGVR